MELEKITAVARRLPAGGQCAKKRNKHLIEIAGLTGLVRSIQRQSCHVSLPNAVSPRLGTAGLDIANLRPLLPAALDSVSSFL